MRDLILRHKLFFGTIIFLVLLIIPLTVFQVQQQQELRQRAEGNGQQPADPNIGIRLCLSGNPITDINQCASSTSSSSQTNYAVKIVAVNNSGKPVDISAFDLELSYDTRYITITPDQRDYGYEIILNRDTLSGGSGSKTRIVGVNNKSNPHNIAPNGVITLAAISIEPIKDSQTGVEIVSSDTKVAVNGVSNNMHKPSLSTQGLFFERNIAAVTGAPAATNTPIPGAPTVAPTATPTIAPTTTPGPTSTPTPIPTPAPGDTVIRLPANAFNYLFTNKKGEKIANKDRNLTIYLYDVNTDPSQDPTGAQSLPTVNITLPSSGAAPIGFYLGRVPAGKYKVLLKDPKYLRALVDTKEILPAGGEITLTLKKGLADGVGDVTKDNVLNISDYEAIRSCFGEKKSTSSCQHKDTVDLNDDDKVDGIDFNLFLKSLSLTTREGD